MGKSLTRKIIESHYVSGSMTSGEEVFIKVDQTLTHDINAVMTYLAFEAIGLDRIRTECSVSYLDHNLLYVDNKTPDDHIYLQSAAKRFGVHVSRPGNGTAMRSMLQDSEFRERSAWAVTATLRTAARSACSVSESAEWMLRLQ